MMSKNSWQFTADWRNCRAPVAWNGFPPQEDADNGSRPLSSALSPSFSPFLFSYSYFFKNRATLVSFVTLAAREAGFPLCDYSSERFLSPCNNQVHRIILFKKYPWFLNVFCFFKYNLKSSCSLREISTCNTNEINFSVSLSMLPDGSRKFFN